MAQSASTIESMMKTPASAFDLFLFRLYEGAKCNSGQFGTHTLPGSKRTRLESMENFREIQIMNAARAGCRSLATANTRNQAMSARANS